MVDVKGVEVTQDVDDCFRDHVFTEGIIAIVVAGTHLGDDALDLQSNIVGDLWKPGALSKCFLAGGDPITKDTNDTLVVFVREIFDDILPSVHEVHSHYDSPQIPINSSKDPTTFFTEILSFSIRKLLSFLAAVAQSSASSLPSCPA